MDRSTPHRPLDQFDWNPSVIGHERQGRLDRRLLPYASDMSHDSSNDSEWSPATSAPGELYTVEGRIRATGAFAQGLKNRDPRGRAYRRSMQRAALLCVGVVVALLALVALISAVT